MQQDASRGSSAFVLGGSVLEPEIDVELSNVAADLARVAEAPVSVVTVTIDRGRAFRARYQLPTELVVSRGTDRDVALCDLVAMAGPLEVTDVDDVDDPAAVPQEVTDCPGLRSCLCVPVRVAGAPIGALCVIDVQARTFTCAQRDGVQSLADRLGRRAASLAAERRARTMVLVQQATAPALVELRAMMGMVDADTAARLARVAEALEAALAGGTGPVSLSATAAAAESLAYAVTGPVGGVRWSLADDAPLAVAPSLASAAVSSALTAVAARVAAAGSLRGLVASARIDGSLARVGITADALDASSAAACAAEVEHALGGDPQVAVCAEGSQVVVRLPRAL